MGRTPGHPWVGESVRLDFANVITSAGAPPFTGSGNAIRYQHRTDPGTAETITVYAGDSFMVGFWDTDVMLSGDDVEAAFAVVCASGSSGTLRLSAGHDPDYELENPALATVPLGTHSAVGETVVVGTLPTFDVDDYIAEASGETVVYIECLTGSVVINQVKLRLWPPGGPLGGWAPADGFTVDEPADAHAVAQDTPASVDAIIGDNPEETFEEASVDLTELAADAGSRAVDDSFPLITEVAASVQAFVETDKTSDTPDTYQAGASFGITGSVLQQPDALAIARVLTPSPPGMTYGLDYTWPPDEVPGDLGVQFPGVDPSSEWGSLLVTASLAPGSSGDGGPAQIVVTPVPDDIGEHLEDLTLPLGPGLAEAPATGSMLLPLPEGERTVLVSMTHPLILNAHAYEGPGDITLLGVWQLGGTFVVSGELGESTVTIPPYLYWSPTAAPETVRRVLRQLHRDDGRGIAPVRAYGGASRIRTGRAYGYD